MQRILTLTLLLFAAFLVGCAGMSKKDCANADWYSYGVQDGQSGQPITAVNRYVESCSKHDIPVNRSQYEQGYDTGIRRYCTPDNGYQVGLNGRALPNVCPSDLAEAFARAHERGYTEFRIRQDINTAEQRLNQLDSQLDALIDQRIAAEARLLAGLDNTPDLDEILRGIENNDREQRTANGQLACATGNWYEAGEEDGLHGRSASSYRLHLRECAGYHPPTDQAAYIQGQSDGVQAYCSYDAGYELGRQGLTPTDLCRGANDRAQQQGLQDGLALFNTQVTISGLQQRSDRLDGTIAALTTQVSDLEARVANPDLTTEQKLALNRELNRARQQLKNARTEQTATVGELNCYDGDWTVIGRSDAEQGLRFNNLSERCGQYGLSVDPSLYERGYQLGLQAYCTRANGRIQGELGQTYRGICPATSEAAFLEGYGPAFEAYQRAQLRKQLEQDLNTIEQELDGLVTTIDQLTTELDRTDLTRNERLALISQIAEYSEQEQSLRADQTLTSAHRQCLTNDWTALGRDHGLSGLDSQLNTLNCRRFGESPITLDYNRGLSEGLQRWCSYERGYDAGFESEPANQSCLVRNISPYQNGYLAGEQAREREQTILELKAEKLDLQDVREPILDELASIEGILNQGDLTADQRQRYERRQARLQRELAPIERRLQEIDQRLNSLL